MAKALTHSESESHLQALKNRASLLLAADEATERTHSLKEVWPDGQPPILAAVSILPFGAEQEAIWQQCLIALGRCSSSALLSAKHFLEVTEAGCDANSVPYPHKILRVGYPKPMPWADSVNALSFDDLEFVLPGARQTVSDSNWSEDNETNVGKAWLQDLAKIPNELRAPMHADSITVDTTLIPWPMFPLNLLIADGHDELEFVQDSQFFQESRYLRACTHQNVQEFDLSLEPWRTMPENVIEHDVCTDAQLTLLEARAKRGPLSETVLARRRANIDPRFFEEVHPTWEKDTALAEMHSRWAKDKAIAAREYDVVAEYGSRFTAWPIPNGRRWPELSRAWVRHAQWFKMWRRSQRVLQAEARKLHASRSSCAESEASWEALSECSDSSWQAVSELSDSSWLEPVTEFGASLQFGKIVNPEALPAYCSALGALDSLSEEDLAKLKLELKTIKEDCEKDLAAAMPTLNSAAESLKQLTKADICEVKAMKAPPHGVVLVGHALCIMFEVKPVKVRAAPSHGKIQATQKPKFDYWETAKRELLASPNLLGRMLAYDKDNIPDSVIIKIKPFLTNPDFQPDQVKKVSFAAHGISQWIHAMVIYHQAAKELQPKKLRLMAAETAVARAEGDQAMKQADLATAFEEDVHEHTDEKVGAHVALMDALTAVDVALAAALPVLNSATVALDSLEKKDIAEIKSMKAPPQPVMIVCMCVVILRPLGKEDEGAGWAAAKKMLSDQDFLRSLQEYNKDGVSAGQIKKIRNLLARQEKVFVGEYMKSVSKACYGLLQWVLAIVRYSEVVHSVEGKRKILKELVAKEGLADDALIINGKADAEVSKAVPVMEAAKAACDCLTKAVIQELKSLGKPPAGVSEVCAVVAFLLRRAEDGQSNWKVAQKMMGNPSQLLNELAAFDATDIPHKVLKECEPIITQPFFTFEIMKTKSIAAAHLTQWVLNVIAYNRIYNSVAPFMAEASEAPKKEEPEMVLHKNSGEEKARQLERGQKNDCLSSCISKAHISELKSLAKPPALVQYTMEPLLILLGREASWNETKVMLCDAKFFSKCESVDKACVDPAIVEKLEPYVNNPNFTPECVAKVSWAAAGVCKWVHDTYNRARANMDDASTVSPTSAQSLDLSRDLEFLDFTLASSPASDKQTSQVQVQCA